GPRTRPRGNGRDRIRTRQGAAARSTLRGSRTGVARRRRREAEGLWRGPLAHGRIPRAGRRPVQGLEQAATAVRMAGAKRGVEAEAGGTGLNRRPSPYDAGTGGDTRLRPPCLAR